MAHDVFISYSTKDKLTADAICHVLEDNNIRCWIAPRNISTGTNYAEEIMDAIVTTKVLVLVYSSNSQNSQFVNKEVETAFSNEKPIIPVRIEDIMPKDDLEYFLRTHQWIDAFPEAEKEFGRLVEDTFKFLGVKDTNPIIDSHLMDKVRNGHYNQPTVKMEYKSLILMLTPLYPIALLYMGISSKMNKLTLEGVITIVPLLLYAYYYLSGSAVYYIKQMNILLNFIIILWIIVLIYFFIIRRDYLFRKDILTMVGDDRQLFDDLIKEYSKDI